MCMSRALGQAGPCWGLHSPDGGAATSPLAFPPPAPAPPPPFLSFLQGRARRHRAGCAVQISAFSLPPGSRALQGPCPPGLGPGPAAGSQTDTSSPAAPLGAGPVAAPPLAGRGPSGGGPPNRASILPERAPAGCDWLIQTHLQRNACLRVPVGVQFKSAAPGSRGRAGAGSEDDSCAGASPRAAVGFLKRVFGRGKSLQKYPLRVQALLSLAAPTPSLPHPNPAAA